MVTNVQPFPLTQAAIDAEQRELARAAAEAEAIAERAELDIAAARARGIDIGRRVVFKGGPHATTLHAWLREVGSDAEGRAMARVQVFCNGPELHALPLARLQAVCGTCDDCKRLADRPACSR